MALPQDDSDVGASQPVQDSAASPTDVADFSDLLATIKEPADSPGGERVRFHFGTEVDKDLPYTPEYLHFAAYTKMLYITPPERSVGTAYAMYLFPLDGYVEESTLYFTWDPGNEPDESAEFWVGLGNYYTFNWDWFRAPIDSPLDLENIQRYKSPAGNLVLVLLGYGEGEYILRWIRIGGNLAPIVEVNTDPEEGPAGEVLVDAGDSVDLDGEIVRYEFDLDWDSTFETDRGSKPFAFAQLTSPGFYYVGARLTDDQGAVSAGSARLLINDWTSESLSEMGDWPLGFAQDDSAAVHLAYHGRNWEEDYHKHWLSYTTNASGTWVSEDVGLLIGFSRTVALAIDSSGAPLIAIQDIADGPEWDVLIRFFQRGADGWSDRQDLKFEPWYQMNMMDMCLDSDDHPHLVYGNDGMAEGSGAFDYLIHDGSDWIPQITHVPATSVDLELDDEDLPYMLMDSYALNSQLLCYKHGDGFLFEVVASNSSDGVLDLNSSGYPRYTSLWWEYLDPYYSQLLALLYGSTSVFAIPDDEEWIHRGIYHDLVLAGDDTAHVCFYWHVSNLDYSVRKGELVYTSQVSNSWPLDRFYRANAISRFYGRPRLALDENDRPLAFVVINNDYYRDSEDDPWYKLVLYKPGD